MHHINILFKNVILNPVEFVKKKIPDIDNTTITVHDASVLEWGLCVCPVVVAHVDIILAKQNVHRTITLSPSYQPHLPFAVVQLISYLSLHIRTPTHPLVFSYPGSLRP